MSEPIRLPEVRESNFKQDQQVYREGTLLEKGIVITTDWVNQHQDLITEDLDLFTVYPDLYLDMIRPENSQFTLFFYQRLFLRACMRYTTLYITAARATSKTFLSILAKYMQCMFVPNHVASIVAPNKNQAAKISKQKIQEIWRIWPLLQNELETYQGEPHANFGKDYCDLYFKNGSRLSIVGALDSDRGIRTHATLVDEVRDQDGDLISTVVLPQMNVSRRMSNGLVNQYEPFNTQVIYATSAGTKSSFAYTKLLDTFEKAIIDPKHNFSIGLDYRIPVLHGLISRDYVHNLKLDPSYTDQNFAAEYMGTWLGGSDESWIDFSKLSHYRTIKNPEWHQIYRGDPHIFYLISVDVGRLSDQTVCCVQRVNIRDNKYFSTLVYIEVLGRQAQTKTFVQQAIDLKRIIMRFNPREVCIDCNGLG